MTFFAASLKRGTSSARRGGLVSSAGTGVVDAQTSRAPVAFSFFTSARRFFS